MSWWILLKNGRILNLNIRRNKERGEPNGSPLSFFIYSSVAFFCRNGRVALQNKFCCTVRA